ARACAQSGAMMLASGGRALAAGAGAAGSTATGWAGALSTASSLTAALTGPAPRGADECDRGGSCVRCETVPRTVVRGAGDERVQGGNDERGGVRARRTRRGRRPDRSGGPGVGPERAGPRDPRVRAAV